MSGSDFVFDDTWSFVHASMLLSKRWRKKKKRNINYTPTLTIREPLRGTQDEHIIKLGHDELEALRLKQINGLGIVSAAKQMWISKSLFAKIYNEAVQKVSQALIYGRSLHIEVDLGSSETFQKPML